MTLPAHAAFLSCYVSGDHRSYDYLAGFLRSLSHGSTVSFGSKIRLPSAKDLPGTKLRIVNKEDVEIEYQLLGDPDWKSTRTIPTTGRLFIYSESELSHSQILDLQKLAESLGPAIVCVKASRKACVGAAGAC
jgi:hypothetical protein